MIKNYNPISDVRNESVELTKRLYRAITDVSRQLDERCRRVQTCEDLFVPSLEAQRVKLREYCERLIFTDPVGYGHKTEEILWRKGYYDVVATAKRLRKNNRWDPLETAYMQNHLSSGVGHYHHILFRLQIEFKLDLRGLIDFPLLVDDEGLVKGKPSSNKILNAESVKWANEAAHNCLLYLGDLGRYFVDLYPAWDTGLTVRYYLQAMNLSPDIGKPHNQLGTLAGAKNFNIDAAYHYMRCLMCPQPFDRAEGNLQHIFENNNKWLEERYSETEGKNLAMLPSERIHCLVSRFLLLADIWFFDKSVLHISELCHQIVGDLVQCLKYTVPIPSEVDLQVEVEQQLVEGVTDENPEYLREDVIFKIVVISLLCAGKLKASSSGQHSIAVAFILGILSKLVHQVIKHIKDSVFHRSLTPFTPEVHIECHPTSIIHVPEVVNVDTPSSVVIDRNVVLLSPETTARDPGIKIKEEKSQKLFKLRRRRRRRSTNSSEGSDLSDRDGSRGSDNEEHLAFSTDDEDDDVEEESSDELPVIQKLPEENLVIIEDSSKAAVDNAIHCNGINNVIEVANGFGEDIPSSLSVNDEDMSMDTETTEEEIKLTMNPVDVIELVAGDRLFETVKILFDWLRGDDLVVEECSVDSRDLLAEIATLLNLINIDSDLLKTEPLCAKIFKQKDINNVFHKIPLPEDVILKGICLRSFNKVHASIDWEYLRHHRIHAKEEALIRVYKLIEFGHFLVTNVDLGVTFDVERRRFIVSKELPKKSTQRPTTSTDHHKTFMNSDENKTSNNSPAKELHTAKELSGPHKGTLMKSMAALWLRGEVKALESKKHGKDPVFSPYLAVDVDALIHHTRLVKQLVGARKFIVLIPTVVITALDDLKGEVPRAREINRWLVLQHEKVNRFVRVQGPNERLPIQLIKYPKKKDKEAWLFFQVVECCQYFNAKYGSNPNVPLVTLLSGQQNCSILGANDEVVKGFSPMGIAKSAGINLEYIETFHAKWKTSSKSHG